jgi:hypothetical protein
LRAISTVQVNYAGAGRRGAGHQNLWAAALSRCAQVRVEKKEAGAAVAGVLRAERWVVPLKTMDREQLRFRLSTHQAIALPATPMPTPNPGSSPNRFVASLFDEEPRRPVHELEERNEVLESAIADKGSHLRTGHRHRHVMRRIAPHTEGGKAWGDQIGYCPDSQSRCETETLRCGLKHTPNPNQCAQIE